jgi:hypothetical protein
MRSPQYVFRVWLMAAGMFCLIAGYQNCSSVKKDNSGNRMGAAEMANEVSDNR